MSACPSRCGLGSCAAGNSPRACRDAQLRSCDTANATITTVTSSYTRIVMRWPQLRAGLIALAIFFGLVDGCPLPPRGKTPEWQKSFVEPIRDVQHAVMSPMSWVRPTLRVGQRWALYQSPSVDRYRLWVEGQGRDGQWQILFRAGDSAHQEDAALIDYSRPRGVWDPTDQPPSQFPLFANWITQRVLDQHRDFIAARVRIEKVRITDDGIEPLGEFIAPYARVRP